MKRLSLITACVATAMYSSTALSQSIDYGAMEGLFGEPVTTSATGKPQRASEAPVTMEILTAEDIRRSGAQNIAEALRGVNGVNVLQSHAQQYDVGIRGYNQLNSQRLLVLVNGRQVYLDHYGTTAWSAIPVQLEEIRQIEVVKGPNTALFGFNAVSGVVNIVTFNPLYDDKSSAGVTVGTNDYKKLHYVQSLKLGDKTGVRISGSRADSEEFNDRANEATVFSQRSDAKAESLSLDVMHQLLDNTQIRAEVSNSNADQMEFLVLGSQSIDDYKTRAAKLSFESDTDYGLIKGQVYQNQFDGKFLGSTGRIGLENKVNVAQLENTIQLNPAHTVRGSVEYRNNVLESKDGGVIPADAQVSYDVYAASAMWNWKFAEGWSWTNAGRVDHLELDRKGSFTSTAQLTNADYKGREVTEFSYNSGLVWQPTEKDTFRGTTARGLEVPSLLEYGFDLQSTTPANNTLAGSPYVDAAVVTSYELAWDRKLDAYIDAGLFRSAIFYSKTEDLKNLFADSANFTTDFSSETDNIGDSRSYGIELALSGEYQTNWDWSLGYIFNIVDDELENRNASGVLTLSESYEKRNPRHEVKFGLGYQNGPWEVDGLAYYMSSTEAAYAGTPPNLPEADIDGYIGVNARAAYTFDKDLTLAVSGMNLQSAETQTGPQPDVERTVFLSLTKGF